MPRCGMPTWELRPPRDLGVLAYHFRAGHPPPPTIEVALSVRRRIDYLKQNFSRNPTILYNQMESVACVYVTARLRDTMHTWVSESRTTLSTGSTCQPCARYATKRVASSWTTIETVASLRASRCMSTTPCPSPRPI